MSKIASDLKQTPDEVKENIKIAKEFLDEANLVSWWTDPATGDTVLWARIPKA